MFLLVFSQNGVFQAMREQKYTEALDGSFKKYLDTKKIAKTPKEKMEARCGALVDSDLAEEAKKYRYKYFLFFH